MADIYTRRIRDVFNREKFCKEQFATTTTDTRKRRHYTEEDTDEGYASAASSICSVSLPVSRSEDDIVKFVDSYGDSPLYVERSKADFDVEYDQYLQMCADIMKQHDEDPALQDTLTPDLDPKTNYPPEDFFWR